MLDFSTVMSVAVVCVAGVMSPGPNFVAVTHRAVSSSRFEAMAMVFGIALVNMLWATVAVFGVGLLVASLPWMFWAIKLMGAGPCAFLRHRPSVSPLKRYRESCLRI